MSGELQCVISSQAPSEFNGTGWLLLLTDTLDSETLSGGTSDVREFGGKGKYVFALKFHKVASQPPTRFTLAKRNYLARSMEIHTSSSPFLSDGADDFYYP